MKSTQYLAREPDDSGFIHYPEAEHQVWNTLITRQLKVIENRACQEYLDGIEQLGLPLERIPQLVFARPTVRDDIEWASGPEQGCKL